MPKASKIAEKKEAKKAAKKAADEEPANGSGAASGSSGAVMELAASMMMGSCLVKILPQLPSILSAPEGQQPPHKNGGSEKPEDEAEEPQAAAASSVGDGDAAAELFAMLQSQLIWCNPLGLASPASGEEALPAWMELVSTCSSNLDFGPRSKKKGTPGLDRIFANVQNNFVQYAHLLLLLMMLRAFLFRSFFACLPWLYGYQTLSVFLPLEQWSLVPQIPLEKVPVKARLGATMALHALMWLFFAWELIVRTYVFEKLLLTGLFSYLAYAIRPAEK
mmetsp:Transcript_68858/g.165282  ORF Transcript_68858/g.165282 Transcript_68858/m.165282 type:complete len:277 (+) Transcript_68858:141-971(+)